MLVYVRSFKNPLKGLTGVAPEKWPDLLKDMSGKVYPHLAAHRLSRRDAKLSLDALMAKYPPPVVGEDA